MEAAQLYEVAADMEVASIPVPSLRDGEVLIKVAACNVVQNLKNVLKGMGNTPEEFPFPVLPAVFGLDAAGTVEECGSLVQGFKPGDRVYVNPGISCGGCEACRSDRAIDCDAFALRGYFGIGRASQATLDAHPQGGFAQYIAASQHNLVTLPDNLDFDTASRFGYLGTAYRALKTAQCGPGKVVLINGITGTLGLGVVALALALGAKRILGTARDTALFQQVEALAKDGRINILELGTKDIQQWVTEQAANAGIDIVIDAFGGGAPAEPVQQALRSLKRGGCMVNIGAVKDEVPVDLFWVLSNNIRIIGSSWFTTGESQKMASMVEQGALDLSFFENEKFSLKDVNRAIAMTDQRHGGFSNYVVNPN